MKVHFFTDDDGHEMLPDSINITPYTTPTTGIGTLGGAAARSSESLLSNFSSALKAHTFEKVEGVMEISLYDLCDKIRQYHSLRQATILSASTYIQRRPIAPHRFVILCLRRTGKENVWIRLDRKPTNRIGLLAGFGVTRANDRVRSYGC
jgi:hypothetical protein